jgi:chromosome segregation ATPase
MREMAREAWTDERLDDLTHRVDAGFKGNEREFQAVRLEMRTEFAAVRSEIKGEIGSVRSEIGSVRSEIGSVRSEIGSVRSEIGGVRDEMAGLRAEMLALHRMLTRVALGGFATLVAGLLGLAATQL